MNKKFSTLVAVILAAGAWTTLDAKVVEVTTPVDNGSYLLGTGINDGTNDFTNALTASGTTVAYGVLKTATAETPTWKLVPVTGGYHLTVGDNTVVIDDSKNSSGALKLVATTSATGSTGADNRPVIFEYAKLTSTNMGFKVIAGWSSINNDIAGQEFTCAVSSISVSNAGTDLVLAAYSEDAYKSMPGLDNVAFNTNGVVDLLTLVADKAVTAPFYITDASGNYLTVKKDGDNYVLATGTDALGTTVPNATQSLNASWRWENGKLVSVAAECDGKVAELTYANAGQAVYGVSNTSNAGTALTAKADGLYSAANKVISQVSVSATSVQADATIDLGVNNTGVIYDGQALKLITSGVPSGYCIVKVGNKYLKAGNAAGVATFENSFSAGTVDAPTHDAYLWKVSRSANGTAEYFYTFTSLKEYAAGKAIVWTENGADKFKATTNTLNGLTLTQSNGSIVTDGTNAAVRSIVAFYEAPVAAQTSNDLNKILNKGFEVTVKISKNSKETLEGADMFNGHKLYAVASSNATTFKLYNEETPDDKSQILVLNTESKVGNDGTTNGKFEWITKKVFAAASAGKYLSDFTFTYDLSSPSTDVIKELKIGDKTVIFFEFDDAYYLTTVSGAAESTELPYIKLGGDNIYDVKKLLGQYLSFSYADTKANAQTEGEEYKLGGMLAVTDNAGTVEADFITGTNATLPEAQWAVTAADKDKNTFTLTNRENKDITLTGVQLREVGNKFVIIATGGKGYQNIVSATNTKSDLVTLTTTALNKTTNFDGYMQSTPNALRNQNYYLGQFHGVDGNNHSYFVENHTDKASHQIGMTAVKENAQKWNLRLATKEVDEVTVVDTVKVPLVFATLIDGEIVNDPAKEGVVTDTLFILPYAFQNASNREFVSYKTGKGFEYYYCNKNLKEESAMANNGTNLEKVVVKFALKMKPDNTYNFVELNMNSTSDADKLGTDKVLGGNSADKGVITQIETYVQNSNSLMVVEKADAPEYHKIAAAWGDTIQLFRDENNAQVLFEKRDDKSVVANDTLSFLNIDNTHQFDINSAIFADTAYVNRTVDGEANTCYQYLLAVNVDPEKSYYCPYNTEHNTDEWRDKNGGPCADAKEHRGVYGRFLINLIDTANVYGATHLHNNWFIDKDEAGEDFAKLSFVEGYHADDTLYVTRQGGETVKLAMDSPGFNVAKFAFRYIDDKSKAFKIQTQYKEYLAEDYNYETAAEFAEHYEDTPSDVSNEGYLKWINGAVVVVKDFENGDVFGIKENYEGTPTANESIDAASAISVVATDGAVIIKGAEGKLVTIVNVLGQPVAKTVITSSEATIAVPAGVVVVAVDGEAAVKAIVK